VVSDDESGPDRPRAPRAQIDLPVSLRFPSVQEFLSACTGDISESGMFIRGEDLNLEGASRRVGEIVSFRLVTGEEQVIIGTARIVRVAQGKEAGIGVEFVDLDPRMRRLIEMIIRIQLAAG
jgi:c-di-GMP-binding flagellar brake protein YcgR